MTIEQKKYSELSVMRDAGLVPYEIREYDDEVVFCFRTQRIRGVAEIIKGPDGWSAYAVSLGPKNECKVIKKWELSSNLPNGWLQEIRQFLEERGKVK